MRHWQQEQAYHGAMPVALPARRDRGRIAHLSGQSAEQSVERHYAARGAACLARRWRGPAGEIDLIFRHGDHILFVEVKAAPSHAAAAARLRPAQMRRIATSAEVFMASGAAVGLRDLRIDVALVDGKGAVEVIENALAGWI